MIVNYTKWGLLRVGGIRRGQAVKSLLTLLSFLLTAWAYAQPTLFQILVTYHHDYQCPQEIAGDPLADQLFQHFGTGFLWKEQYVVTTYHTLATACGNYIEVRDPSGKIHEAQVVGTETLLDVALLKLCDPLPGGQSAYFFDEMPATGLQVQVAGHAGNGTNGTTFSTHIKEVNTVMPGCFGSHRLAFSLEGEVDKGFSGAPVWHQGRVLGMILARSTLHQATYALQAPTLQQILDGLLRNDRLPRPYLGGVFTANSLGVRLTNVLPKGNPALRPFVAQVLTHLNGQAIQDLVDLRTLLESLPFAEWQRLSCTFRDLKGQVRTVSIKPVIFSTAHSEEITDYFDQAKLLPFRLPEGLHSLCIAEGLGTYQLYRGDCLEVISLPQVDSGLRCRDVFDLGLILKTFGPTGTELTFHFKQGSRLVPIPQKMPGILIN